jgi:FemAB-related protein (PEP-CTERM system-associated)
MEIPDIHSETLCPPLASDARAQVLVRTFRAADAASWDDFVLRHPRGTPFHLTSWKQFLEQTFQYEPSYFIAERSGRLTGVAPFFWISNWVMGRCLMSVPLAAYGGILTLDPESEAALLRRTHEAAASRGAGYVELRNRNGGLIPGFHLNPRYVTFSTILFPDPQQNWKRLPRDTRYMIRKGEKLGLTVRVGLNELPVFYKLLAKNYHKLGTPVFPFRMFENLVTAFGKQWDLRVIYAGTKPVSAIFSFLFRDTVLPYYSGATSEAPRFAANNFMYWELMKHAAESGFRYFDFGRSKKGTGSYAFKTSWNMEEQQLDYQVYLVRRKTVPDFSPLNPRFALGVRAWQRLPFWLATRLGPQVVRWFP